MLVSILGSGDIQVNGYAEKLTTHISGSGNAALENLHGNTAKTLISGSGHIEIGSFATLDASISGSGSISYKGNPIVTKSITGSGSISKN